MDRSIVICPDEALAEQLASAVVATGEVWINKVIGRYPSALDLVRSMRAHAPDIIFLDFESVEKAQAVVKTVEAEATGVQIIGIARQVDATLLRVSLELLGEKTARSGQKSKNYFSKNEAFFGRET